MLVFSFGSWESTSTMFAAWLKKFLAFDAIFVNFLKVEMMISTEGIANMLLCVWKQEFGGENTINVICCTPFMEIYLPWMSTHGKMGQPKMSPCFSHHNIILNLLYQLKTSGRWTWASSQIQNSISPVPNLSKGRIIELKNLQFVRFTAFSELWW